MTLHSLSLQKGHMPPAVSNQTHDATVMAGRGDKRMHRESLHSRVQNRFAAVRWVQRCEVSSKALPPTSSHRPELLVNVCACTNDDS